MSCVRLIPNSCSRSRSRILFSEFLWDAAVCIAVLYFTSCSAAKRTILWDHVFHCSSDSFRSPNLSGRHLESTSVRRPPRCSPPGPCWARRWEVSEATWSALFAARWASVC